MSADHRVMVQGARIQSVQVERGVSPGWGGQHGSEILWATALPCEH